MFLRKLFLLLCFLTASHPAIALEVGDELKLPELKTIQGKIFTQLDYSKRFTIVQIWATTCPFCRFQNKNLDELLKKIEPKQVNLILLSVDKNTKVVEDYLEKNQYRFDVVMMTPDLTKRFGKRRWIPELYVIDPKGKIIQKDMGQMIDLDIYDLARFAR